MISVFETPHRYIYPDIFLIFRWSNIFHKSFVIFVYKVALVHEVDHPWMLQTIHIQCKYSGWSSLCSELSSVHFDLWTFASGQNSGFPRIQGWEEPLNGRHRQLTAGLSTPYLFYPRFPSLLRRDRQRVGHWRVENCANPGEQVAGSTRAGVPANRGVITYTSVHNSPS